jgi:membrane protein YdbS with pleckstrin-like domain
MTNHSKKITNAIIISFCLIAYCILYVLIILKLKLSTILKVGLSAVTVVIAVATVMVMIERIREIKKGEEDDLSKY